MSISLSGTSANALNMGLSQVSSVDAFQWSVVGFKGTPLGHVGRSDLPRWAAHRGFCHLQKATFSGDDSDHKILRRR